jgi:hypothetical protein
MPDQPTSCDPACSEQHAYRLGSCAQAGARVGDAAADQSWSVPCPTCGTEIGFPCYRQDGTPRAVSCSRRWTRWDRKDAAAEDAGFDPDNSRTTLNNSPTSGDAASCSGAADATVPNNPDDTPQYDDPDRQHVDPAFFEQLQRTTALGDDPEIRAAYASCPGHEMKPNPCRCPCYGCKHNCYAHQPLDVAADPEDDDEDDTPHCERPHATPRELELRQRRAWSATGSCPMCGFGDSDGRLCTECVITVRGIRPARLRRQWDRYQPANSDPPNQSHGYTPAGLLGMAVDESDAHVCKPDATTYYCPTSGEMESDCHGGFDVCCDRPDLHTAEAPSGLGTAPDAEVTP